MSVIHSIIALCYSNFFFFSYLVLKLIIEGAWLIILLLGGSGC